MLINLSNYSLVVLIIGTAIVTWLFCFIELLKIRAGWKLGGEEVIRWTSGLIPVIIVICLLIIAFSSSGGPSIFLWITAVVSAYLFHHKFIAPLVGSTDTFSPNVYGESPITHRRPEFQVTFAERDHFFWETGKRFTEVGYFDEQENFVFSDGSYLEFIRYGRGAGYYAPPSRRYRGEVYYSIVERIRIDLGTNKPYKY